MHPSVAAGSASTAALHLAESRLEFPVRQARAPKPFSPVQYFAMSSEQASASPPPGGGRERTRPPGPTTARPVGSGADPCRNQSGDWGLPAGFCENASIAAKNTQSAIPAAAGNLFISTSLGLAQTGAHDCTFREWPTTNHAAALGAAWRRIRLMQNQLLYSQIADLADVERIFVAAVDGIDRSEFLR